MTLRPLLTATVVVLATLAAPTVRAADGDGEPPLKVPPPPGRDSPLFVPAEYPMPGHTTGSGYQMRCWQKGQLLFTETNLSEPVIANLPGKVATFAEKSGNSTYLIEVAESLCLIKKR
jgi:hypothetical protein